MTEFLEYPIKHTEDNLIFSKDGAVTAYFEIPGFGYDFLSEDEKFMPFINQLTFLQTQGHDLHLLSLPQSNNIEDITQDQKERMKLKAQEYQYDLLEAGLSYQDLLTDVLVKHNKATEKREYRNYIGVQLNRKLNRYKPGNAGTNFLVSLREFFIGLNSPVNQAIGLEAADILLSEIEAYKDQAKAVEETLKRTYVVNRNRQIGDAVRPLSTIENLMIAELMYSATTSFRDVEPRYEFVTGETIKVAIEGKEEKAVRPNVKAYLDLQESYISEISPNTLEISKQVDNETETIYTRAFVLTKFAHNDNDFPGYEWPYKVQRSLSFPIMMSVRLYHKDNQSVLKELSNTKLEFNDQKEQAHKARVQVDLQVAENERGVIKLEKYFQDTGYPSYVNSFTFRINADSKKELDARAAEFEDKMRTFGITVKAPFGEQPALFMEMLPGSKQINQDYKNETDPRMVAGMMFGASSSLGDNQGFYIGDTLQGKPVFIWPELASKAHEGVATAVNSISCLVAGATGFGKSVLMNLLTFLSVLCGAYALIIDPKGDRKKWIDGLPFIAKKYVSVWELTDSEEHSGILDPFRTSPDTEKGRSVATNIFASLARTNVGEEKYSLLSKAFKYAASKEEPCVGEAISYLRRLHDSEESTMTSKKYEELDSLLSVLDTFMDEPYIKLLIGKPGDKHRSLSVDKPLQVLMIENLTLPKAEKDPEKYTPSERIGTAIMISITAFSQQFMMGGDRTRHKVILSDEADVMDRNDTGRELNNFIVRRGRYYTTTLLKGAQNASDHGNDVANLGMKFCFALKKTDEAREMLDYFDLPQTNENIDRLKTLDRGTCLFQDIYGRTDVLKVNPVFKQILDAFDTSTSSEKEREFEKRKKEKMTVGS
ncbi:ATP-binding protein [Bacillus subtilis]|uniref:ATP-binding protein n=1 Tax=Bacillus subtilis TaxID=1423 RepID=UPI00136315AD|nr:ATP-binding protein [Bacillus subtilis]QHK01212.1 hypothetical protein C7M17_04407 [Bacillus subtilis]WBC28203.1 ATP-binding protein [Bacillus subtilis]